MAKRMKMNESAKHSNAQIPLSSTKAVVITEQDFIKLSMMTPDEITDVILGACELTFMQKDSFFAGVDSIECRNMMQALAV